MTVRLHIEHLVLDGLPVSRAQGVRVKAAIEAELARLLSERDLAPDLRAGIAMPRLDAGTMRIPRHATPQTIGKQIARSIATGLAGR